MYSTHILVLHFTCTTHICLLYKGTLMYILDYEIQYNISVFLTWYQSHCSDLFLAVLSLLVLLHSQHRFRCHNSHRSLSSLNLQHLPAVVLEFRTCNRCRWGVLHHTDYCTCHHRRLYCSNCISRGITKIIFSQSTHRWKPRSHRRRHAPSRAAQRFCVNAPRVVLSFSWRHPWRHQCHVNPSYISIQSSTDISATSSCWHHSLTVNRIIDFERWLFSKVDFFNPGSPYLVFHIDFIFAVCFYILCL